MTELTCGHESLVPGRDQIIEFLGPWSALSGAWIDSLHAFAPALVLSAAWLIWARARRWRAGYVTLPVLLWASQAHQLLWDLFHWSPSHPVFVLDALTSAVVALIATALMMSGMTIGAGVRPAATKPHTLSQTRARRESEAWAAGLSSSGIALVIVGTTALDWLFVLLCITPIH